MNNKQLLGDKIISIAVFIQPLLTIFQFVLMDVFKIAGTTIFRVFITSSLMLMAIFIGLKRKPSRFIIWYCIFGVLLTITCMLFPQNIEFVETQGLRFLLPVIIPSALCISTVYDFSVVRKYIYVISWFCVLLAAFYVVEYFRGIFFITTYNMSFSFSCLFPMIVLYSNEKVYNKIVSFALFILVIAIGSRGAALCFLLFLLYQILMQKNKWKFLVILLVIAFIVFLPQINDWLSSLGIESRTLKMLFEGNISSDSGRSSIQKVVFAELLDHPFLGLGFYGDRLIDVYCHNLFLEICTDFGFFFGSIIIIILIVIILSIYYHSDKENRSLIVAYFCIFVMPLMTSSSYLISSDFAIFCGLCYLIKINNNKNVDGDFAKG